MNIIRLKDSFEVLGKSIVSLDKAIVLYQNNKYDDETILVDVITSRFKYVFECFWKFLKRYLEVNGELLDNIKIPKQILIKSYEYNLIENEKIWLDMLKDKNVLSHVYDEEEAFRVYHDIVNVYYPNIKNTYDNFKKLVENDRYN